MKTLMIPSGIFCIEFNISLLQSKLWWNSLIFGSKTLMIPSGIFSIDFNIRYKSCPARKIDFQSTLAILSDLWKKQRFWAPRQLKISIFWTLAVKNMDFADFLAILMAKNKNFKH